MLSVMIQTIQVSTVIASDDPVWGTLQRSSKGWRDNTIRLVADLLSIVLR